jgi:hypothetical protein
MLKTLAGDQVPIASWADQLQVALNCLVRHHRCPEISEDAAGVSLAGRFDDPGDHQITEHRIANDIEAEPVIDRGDGVVEQP